MFNNSVDRITPEYLDWRNSVLLRDNKSCVLCKSKRILHAHHIQRWVDSTAQRFDTTNGITLCSTCHEKIHDGKGKKVLQDVTIQLLTHLVQIYSTTDNITKDSTENKDKLLVEKVASQKVVSENTICIEIPDDSFVKLPLDFIKFRWVLHNNEWRLLFKILSSIQQNISTQPLNLSYSFNKNEIFPELRFSKLNFFIKNPPTFIERTLRRLTHSAPFKNNTRKNFRFLNEVVLKGDIITVEINQELKNLLCHDSEYIQYPLKSLLALDSMYTVRLYILMSLYDNNSEFFISKKDLCGFYANYDWETLYSRLPTHIDELKTKNGVEIEFIDITPKGVSCRTKYMNTERGGYCNGRGLRDKI